METMPYPRKKAPPLARVRQKLPSDRIADPRKAAAQCLLDAGLRQKVRPGARIAITAGSRDMGDFVKIVSGVVDAVKAAGGEPFIIPAMGSHGGAVAEGQEEILRRLGVTGETVGAPVNATMETIALGASKTGAVAHLDRYAAEADGIIVLARTKTHPESDGPIASGLLKMTVVGLGKQHGAQEAHSHELFKSVEAVPRVHFAQGAKILFGVAVVENGYRHPVAIEAIPGTYRAFVEADKRLLKLAKEHLSTLPFTQMDVLVIDQIGKTISGTCMDPHVIGKWRITGKGPHKPDYSRIVALSLTNGSLGNALGIGAADFTTRRLADAYDPRTTTVNMLTATEPGSWNSQEGALPTVLPSDQEAIEVALYSALANDRPKVCRIKSTELLDEIWVSEALLDELKGSDQFQIEAPPKPLPFDSSGNLPGVG